MVAKKGIHIMYMYFALLPMTAQCCVVSGVLMVCTSGIQVALYDELSAKVWWALLLLIVFVLVMVVVLVIIARQPHESSKLTFKVCETTSFFIKINKVGTKTNLLHHPV